MLFGRRIARNAIIILTARLIVAALNLILVGLIARYLGKSLFGSYSVIFAAATIVADISAAGMNLILIRQIAAADPLAPQYVSAAMNLRVVIAGVLGAIALLIVVFIPIEPEVKLASLAAIFWMFSLLSIYLYTAVLFGRERFDLQAILSVGNMALTLALTLLAVRLNLHLSGIFLASAAANLVAAKIGFGIAFRKLLTLEKPQTRSIYVQLVKESFPVGLATVFRGMYERVDVFILGARCNRAEVGIFNAPYRIVEQLIVIPNMIVRPAFPILSKLARTDPRKFNKVFCKLLLVFLLLAAVVSGALYLLAPLIVLKVFGPEFGESVAVMRWLSPMLFLMFPNSLLWFALIARGAQSSVTYGLAGTLVVNAVVDFFLVPHYGAVGACIGTLAAQFAFILYCIVEFLLRSRRPVSDVNVDPVDL